MFSYNLNEIRASHGYTIAIIILSLILAPLAFLFQFALPLFERTEWIKLILICLSFSFPVFIANTVISGQLLQSIVDDYSPIKDDMVKNSMEWAGMNIMVVFYIPAAINFIFKMEQKTAIIVAIAIQFILMIVFEVVTRKNNRNNPYLNTRKIKS